MQKIKEKLLTSDLAQQPAESKAVGRQTGGMTPTLSFILKEVQRELGYQVRSDAKSTELPSSAELEALVNRIALRLGFELTNFERDEVLLQIEREQKPFGILQELVDDPNVTDIIITDYAKISVQQGKRNFSTGLAFASQENYEAFVERLLQRAGTTFSTKKPIADGMIGSFARLHAVHRSICETGPYLTVRLNRFSRVTLNDLLQHGMAPQAIFDYLRALIQVGHTILIVGEVGTGKTTLARALAACIPEEEAILVIEDTPEIRLEHPHVRYVTTRESNTDGAGRIAPSECIRAGMRMAMNRIIFGEMRDAEAAESFIDVCSSGHPGFSTIHARSSAEAVTRLELFLGRAQRGVARNVLTEQIATAVQVMVHVDICKITGKRRIMEVREIGPVADGVLRTREMFRYEVKDNFPVWRTVNKVSAYREYLERVAEPVLLHTYPNYLECSSTVNYREAQRRMHVV